MVHMGDTEKLLHMCNNYHILNIYAEILINEKNNFKLIATCLETLSMLLQLGNKLKQKTGQINILVVELMKVPRMV